MWETNQDREVAQDGVGRTERRPDLAGPLPPRRRHHRRDQRLRHQDRRLPTTPQHGVRTTPGHGSSTPPPGRPRCGSGRRTGWAALDVAVRTEDFYRSLLRRHILPRWGDHGLADISGIKAAVWAKELRDQGYSPRTVTGIMKLLSLLLADAAEERLIPANPIRARRRGRRRAERVPERVWATPAEVLAVADNAARLPGGGPDAAILIVTAAWTGARWGELTGLQRTHTHLDTGLDTGVASGCHGDRPRRRAPCTNPAAGLALGPPKTVESARTITLPPFLVELLRAYLATHDHPHVFVSPDRQLYRRSNFSRRALRPAADGAPRRRDPEPAAARR